MDDQFHVDVQETGPYLTAQVRGSLSLQNMKGLVDTVVSESRRRGCNRFLVDMLQTGPPAREMDRFYIGEYLAARFHAGLKVAVVYPSELINKFTENTAVNRGAALRVVGSREEALAWLLKGLGEEEVD